MSEKLGDSKECAGRLVFLVCGFGSLKWAVAARRLSRQLRNLPCESEVHTYTNRDLSFNFPKLLDFIDSNYGRKTRGFGYWIWKPYIIDKELSALKPKDVLIYIDSGCEVVKNANSNVILENYINYAQTNNILAMKLDASMHEYCEIHIAKHFGLTSAQFNNLSMISATMLVITGTPNSRQLVSDWLKCALDNPKLLSGSSTYSGHEGFIAHRHDQSILSALIHQNQIKPYANQLDFDPKSDGSNFELFYAARNKHIFSIMPNTFFGKVVRMRWWFYRRFNKGFSP
jgi:hypothetical protein